jgi:Dolichyl-phosphate-mannose-protein mannosyltransferase
VTTTERPVSPATVAEWRRRKEADGGLPPDGHNGQSVNEHGDQPRNGHGHNGQSVNGHGGQSVNGHGGQSVNGHGGQSANGHGGQSANGHGGQSANSHDEQPRNGRGGPPAADESAKIRNAFRLPAYAVTARARQSSPAGPFEPGQPVSAGAREQDPAQELQPGFAEAQQAGLTAILSIAKNGASPPLLAVESPAPRRLGPLTLPPVRASDPAFSPPGSVVAPTAPASEQRSIPMLPGEVPSGRLATRKAQSNWWRRVAWNSQSLAQVRALPLTVILIAQVILSLRLIWSNTAFSDEALYLWAGRLELAHWLHGTAIPAFPTYFSGAPVIYPPLGALANSLGGLAGARVLSLCFMLAATVLLYTTTSRVFGRKAGGCAAAIFTALGPVQVLGAFATYDAMAIFLIALATWFVIRARGVTGEWFLIAAGLALALADATKYASALWTPVVVILAALTGTQSGWARSVFRGARLAAYTIVPLALALDFGGKPYVKGVMFSTLNRRRGDTPALTLLTDSGKWIGVVLALAVIGTVISFMTPGRLRWICVTLTIAGLLAPLHQAQIQVYTSLHKHVAFGAWFAAIAAGYALAKAAEVNEAKGWRVVGVVAGLSLFFFAIPQSTVMFYGWPDSFQMTRSLARVIKSAGCPCLIAEQSVVSYYIQGTNSDLLVGPYGFSYWSRAENRELQGIPAYRQAIRDHYFSVVEIDRGDNPALVQPVVQALTQTSGYRLVDLIPIAHWGQSSFEIWRWGDQ